MNVFCQNVIVVVYMAAVLMAGLIQARYVEPGENEGYETQKFKVSTKINDNKNVVQKMYIDYRQSQGLNVHAKISNIKVELAFSFELLILKY